MPSSRSRGRLAAIDGGMSSATTIDGPSRATVRSTPARRAAIRSATSRTSAARAARSSSPSARSWAATSSAAIRIAPIASWPSPIAVVAASSSDGSRAIIAWASKISPSSRPSDVSSAASASSSAAAESRATRRRSSSASACPGAIRPPAGTSPAPMTTHGPRATPVEAGIPWTVRIEPGPAVRVRCRRAGRRTRASRSR